MAHRETMTSKQRVLSNYSFESIDRFSIDWCACSEVYERMRTYYGVATDLELMQKLHVDFRYPKPEWIGFPLVDEKGRSLWRLYDCPLAARA